MLYAICDNEIATERVTTLKVGQAFTINLLSTQGFKRESVFILREVPIDEHQVDTEPLFDDLPIIIENDEMSHGPHMLTFHFDGGFLNTGTRRIDIVEVTKDHVSTRQFTLLFDVSVAVSTPVKKQRARMLMAYAALLIFALLSTGVVGFLIGDARDMKFDTAQQVSVAHTCPAMICPELPAPPPVVTTNSTPNNTVTSEVAPKEKKIDEKSEPVRIRLEKPEIPSTPRKPKSGVTYYR